MRPFQLLHQARDVIEVDARKSAHIVSLDLESRSRRFEGSIEAVPNRVVQHFLERAPCSTRLRLQTADDVVLECHRRSLAHINDDTHPTS